MRVSAYRGGEPQGAAEYSVDRVQAFPAESPDL